MRHNEEGGEAETAPQFLKNTGFCGRVEARGGLVQNQHPRLLQKSSGEGKALTLPTRKLAAVRSDSLAKTVRQRSHEVGQSHHPDGVFDFPLGSLPTERTAYWTRWCHRTRLGRAANNRRAGAGS